jgi:hypothetical protein
VKFMGLSLNVHGGPLTIDPKHADYLDFCLERIEHDHDAMILLDGYEGTGKSSLAFLSAYYMNKKFCLDNIIYTIEDFRHAVETAEPGTVIVWDEFVLAGLASNWQSKIQQEIIRTMTLMRHRRIILILVIPNLWLLKDYFADHRTLFLMHTFTPDGIKRGIIRIYNHRKKRILYWKGKLLKDHDLVKPSHKALADDFFRANIINREDYIRKKIAAENSVRFDG